VTCLRIQLPAQALTMKQLAVRMKETQDAGGDAGRSAAAYGDGMESGERSTTPMEQHPRQVDLEPGTGWAN
jgi:hypothetical protein